MKINYKIVNFLKKNNLTISTAESITGGKIVSTLIEVPGASKIIEKGFVVYSNDAKFDCLNVGLEIISKMGVVSEEIAVEMAKKTKLKTNTNIVVSTTGEAGPVANDKNIDVGTVCFGMIINDKIFSYKKIFRGSRVKIINKSTKFILEQLYLELLNIQWN